MAIFHCYVSSPEGKDYKLIFQFQNGTDVASKSSNWGSGPLMAATIWGTCGLCYGRIAARLRQCKRYSWKHNYWAVRSPNNAGLTTQVAAKMRCYIEWCYTVTHVWVKGWILWLCGLEASQLDYFLEIYLSCLPVCFFESTVRRWCRFRLQTKLHASILSLFGLITPFLHLLAPFFSLQILPKLH